MQIELKRPSEGAPGCWMILEVNALLEATEGPPASQMKKERTLLTKGLVKIKLPS